MNSIGWHSSILALVYLSIIFIITQFKRESRLGRFAWVGGVWLISLYTLIAVGTYFKRPILVTFLISIWAIRLLLHVIRRHYEIGDPRFFDWQVSWGSFGLFRSFVWIYLCQGLLLAIMALPGVIVNLYSQQGLGAWDYGFLALWLFGFYWEAMSDYQLSLFLKKSVRRNEICIEGLWGLSRHPNYFGELVQWWALALFACLIPGGWIALLAPIALTVYLVLYSGVPCVEGQLSGYNNYGYYKTLSLLIPIRRK